MPNPSASPPEAPGRAGEEEPGPPSSARPQRRPAPRKIPTAPDAAYANCSDAADGPATPLDSRPRRRGWGGPARRPVLSTPPNPLLSPSPPASGVGGGGASVPLVLPLGRAHGRGPSARRGGEGLGRSRGPGLPAGSNLRVFTRGAARVGRAPVVWMKPLRGKQHHRHRHKHRKALVSHSNRKSLLSLT